MNLAHVLLSTSGISSVHREVGGGADGQLFSCFLFRVLSLFLFLAWEAGLGLVGGESLLLQWMSAYHSFLQGVSLNNCQLLSIKHTS